MKFEISGLFEKINMNNDLFKIETINTNIRSDFNRLSFKENSFLYPIIEWVKNDNQFLHYKIGSNGFTLPTSHIIELKNISKKESELDSPELFFSLILGFLTSFNVLPEDHTYIMERIRFKKGIEFYYPYNNELEQCLINSLSTWNNLNKEQRKIILNILIVFDRSLSYQQTHIQYNYLYSLNDVIFKYLFNYKKQELNLDNSDINKTQVHRITHKKRFKYLLNYFNLNAKNQETQVIIDEIYTIRNNLIHDLDWESDILLYRNDPNKDKTMHTILFYEIIGLSILKLLNLHIDKDFEYFIHNGFIAKTRLY